MSMGLEERATKAATWMAQSASLWSRAGVHPSAGFWEELDMAGAPLEAETARVRVQARQTFCFALLQRLAESNPQFDGDRARELCRHGLDALVTHCRRPDGLFGRRMAHAGGLVDDTADLYDNAFTLLAFSAAAQAGHTDGAAEAGKLSALIDIHFARPQADDGFFEKLPTSDVRLQNPHMHLFEASLLHAAVTESAASLSRGRTIERLMETRFLNQQGGLREIFRPGWGPMEGDRLETGHQFEWVWLLHQHAKLEDHAVTPAAETLYKTANGLTGDGGAVFLEHHLSGSLKDSTRRCWSVTEALKAHLARFEAGEREAAQRACEAYDQLQDVFLLPAAVPGGWIDRHDGLGNPLSLTMPASTGYHVYLAIAELMRVAGAAHD
ncbi:MAG: AGE family epimerase/isomerase [Pseudomonadota bacterium]